MGAHGADPYGPQLQQTAFRSRAALHSTHAMHHDYKQTSTEENIEHTIIQTITDMDTDMSGATPNQQQKHMFRTPHSSASCCKVEHFGWNLQSDNGASMFGPQITGVTAQMPNTATSDSNFGVFKPHRNMRQVSIPNFEHTTNDGDANASCSTKISSSAVDEKGRVQQPNTGVHVKIIDAGQGQDNGAALFGPQITHVATHSPHQTEHLPLPPPDDNVTCSSRTSNNPAGRSSRREQAQLWTTEATFKTMLYKCPRTDSVPCEGIYVQDPTERQHEDEVQMLSAAIVHIRTHHHINIGVNGSKRHTNKQAKVTALLWDLSGGTRTPPSKLTYNVGQRRVCSWCYCAAAGLLQEPRLERKGCTWIKGVKDYLHKEQGSSPSKQTREAVRPITSTYGMKFCTVFAWWCEYVQDHSANDVQHGTTDDTYHVSGTTYKELREEYAEHLAGRGCSHLLCSQTYFNQALHEMNATEGAPTLKIDPWKYHAECATCVALKILRRRAAKSGDTKVVEFRKVQLEAHKKVARKERWMYAWRIARGVTLTYAFSIAMDGYDSKKSAGPAIQSKGLHDLKGAGGVADAEQVKFKTTGVLVHGGGYHLYVADPTIPGNGNFNVHCLWRTLCLLHQRLNSDGADALKHWPAELYVQVDGASDNRCSVFFMFMELLIRKRVFKCIYVSFLMVGHTHNDADQKFVAITKQLRRDNVHTIHDLLKIYKAAYKNDEPKCIEHVEAVYDWTEWLKLDHGEPWEGMARRTPDDERAHQLIFEASGVDGCKGSYKRNSYDLQIWNTSDLHLLKVTPTTAPPMQPPRGDNLKKLAASRPRVMKNFELNAGLGAVFTEEDRKWYDNLFDRFSTSDGQLKQSLDDLSTYMATKLLPWEMPPAAELVIDETVELERNEPGVEPIIHANQTKEKQKEIRDHYAARRAARGSRPELVRGIRATTRAAAAIIERLEAEMEERLGRATSATGVIDLAEVVGIDLAREMECMALVHWMNAKWRGHEREYEWVSMADIENEGEALTSIDEELVGSSINVSFGTARGAVTVYEGVLAEWLDDYKYLVKYADGDNEVLNLRTLEHEVSTLLTHCLYKMHSHPMLYVTPLKPSLQVYKDQPVGTSLEKRVRWVLSSCSHITDANVPRHVVTPKKKVPVTLQAELDAVVQEGRQRATEIDSDEDFIDSDDDADNDTNRDVRPRVLRRTRQATQNRTACPQQEEGESSNTKKQKKQTNIRKKRPSTTQKRKPTAKKKKVIQK